MGPEMEPTAHQLVIFTVAGEKYALPIDRVQEIIRYTAPRPLDGGDDALRGVIALRGSIIPVYDLATRLGLAAGEGRDGAEIVIVEGPEQTIGVVVDDVDEVRTVPADAIEAVHVGTDALTGIARLGDRLVALIDADAVFAGAPVAAPAPVRLAA
jgi:purine-binding chemotaxis protein CheW